MPQIDEYAKGREDEREEWEVEADEILVEYHAPPLPDRILTPREVFETIIRAARRRNP